jgi:hypothetical protein
MKFTIGHRLRIFPALPGVKCSKAVAALCWSLSLAVFTPGAASVVTPGAPILETALEDFSPAAYGSGVAALFTAFERERGEAIRPGDTGRVGLKIYTGSGPGLATPQPLVRGVIAALVERGFERENIFLVDLNETRLRRSGFLPPLSETERTFDGHPVLVLESGRYYDSAWYYDSALPPRSEPSLGAQRRDFRFQPEESDRHSLLAAPLLQNLDFWINLPVYTDHPVLGLNGALVNATLWNASNTLRFFQSEVNGPAAVAEMAAVPELAEKWLFTIVSRERFQFLGGPAFRSLYTASEPALMLGADPVALDAEMFRRLNAAREARGFRPIDEEPTQLEYAAQLRLGRSGALVIQVDRTSSP